MSSQPSALEGPEEAVRRVIGEMLDDDAWELIKFTPDLKLGDLNLSSVDYVMIVDRLTRAYCGTVDFVSWFRAMPRETLVSLRVQDLVGFIESHAKRGDRAGGEAHGLNSATDN
jgi:hypothetical protein